MTHDEAQAWLAETRRSRTKWQVDLIHNEPHDTLIYKGGRKGQFVGIRTIEGGTGVMIGTYTGAIPHIGEAAFSIKGRKRVDDWASALRWLSDNIPELEPLLTNLKVDHDAKSREFDRI